MGTRLARAFAALLCLLSLPALAAEGEVRPESGETPAQTAPSVGNTPAAPGESVLLPPPPLLPEQPPHVRTVELHMPAGSDPSGFSSLVAVRNGGRLSMREVRRSIERLHATERVADVVVRSRDVGPNEIDVIFEVTPVRFVTAVEFQGNTVLSSDVLRRSAGLEERSRIEYYPERVDRLVQRMKSAYARVGYASAEFSHTVASQGAESVLRFTVREGSPTRVLAVTVAGDPQRTIQQVIDIVGIKAGSVLDHEKLEAGVRALRSHLRAQKHYRARVSPAIVTQVLGGAVVQIPVSAGPVMQFRFSGNRVFDDDTLLEKLGYGGDEALDAQLVSRLEGRIAAFYRLNGFADVRVSAREVLSEDRKRAVVVFSVFEGEPLLVTQVDFEGNSHFDDQYLRDRLDESLRSAAEVPPLIEGVTVGEAAELGISGRESRKSSREHRIEPTQVYVESVYVEAIGRIMELYRADGYLSAIVEMPVVERLDDERPGGKGARRTAKVTMRVNEGVQTLVSNITFPGAPPGARSLSGQVTLREGKPFNSLEVENSRLAVKRALARDGYLYAAVNDRGTFSPDRRSVDVAYEIDPGPRVKVGRIILQGLDRTREEVVRASLAVHEDEYLDPEDLAESQRNLIQLGIFRGVSLRLNAPEDPEPLKDVYVALEERNAANLTLGAGFSLVEGPRAFAEYNRYNLLGSALQLQARAKFNLFNYSYTVLSDPKLAQYGLDQLGRRINLGLQYPRVLALLPLEIGSRVDLVHERVIRPAYGFTRGAAIFGANWAGQGPVSVSLQYELESDEVKRNATTGSFLSRDDRERLRFDEGTIYLHSLRPTISVDLRDDPANPRKGFWISGSTEFVQSLGGEVQGANGLETPHSLFVKASGQASAFIPLPKKVVLALALKGGKVFPLDDDSRTIAPKRFFQGGASTMRGFRDDAMIPEDRRQVLREQARQCSATLNRTGCTEAALNLMTGEPLFSEGGELFTLARNELRFPLSNDLEAALFLDAGNLWLDQSQYDPLALRYATGVGLRLVTPIGPAAFDLGVNLFPDTVLNENQFVGHFSIGVF